MEKSELKKCPFCGGEGDIEFVYRTSDPEEVPKEIPFCKKCKASGTTIKAWNRRTPDKEAVREVVV